MLMPRTDAEPVPVGVEGVDGERALAGAAAAAATTQSTPTSSHGCTVAPSSVSCCTARHMAHVARRWPSCLPPHFASSFQPWRSMKNTLPATVGAVRQAICRFSAGNALKFTTVYITRERRERAPLGMMHNGGLHGYQNLHLPQGIVDALAGHGVAHGARPQQQQPQQQQHQVPMRKYTPFQDSNPAVNDVLQMLMQKYVENDAAAAATLQSPRARSSTSGPRQAPGSKSGRTQSASATGAHGPQYTPVLHAPPQQWGQRQDSSRQNEPSLQQPATRSALSPRANVTTGRTSSAPHYPRDDSDVPEPPFVPAQDYQLKIHQTAAHALNSGGWQNLKVNPDGSYRKHELWSESWIQSRGYIRAWLEFQAQADEDLRACKELPDVREHTHHNEVAITQQRDVLVSPGAGRHAEDCTCHAFFAMRARGGARISQASQYASMYWRSRVWRRVFGLTRTRVSRRAHRTVQNFA
jgi:hypothetical protein